MGNTLKTVLKTAYANQQSASAYEKAGDAANKGTIIHYADSIQDTDFAPNSVFGMVNGTADTSDPIAQINKTIKDDGTPTVDIAFYDDHSEKMKVWAQLVHKYKSPREAYRQVRTSPSVGAIVNTQSIDKTKSLNILDGLLGLQVRDFFGQLVTTKLGANNLVFTVDRFTEGTVQAKVGEMQEPDLVSHEESRITKILYKNVGHIAETEESRLMALHDTMGLRQEKTIKDMNRLLNAQICEEINTMSVAKGNLIQAGADWGAHSAASAGAPDSVNNPIDDIQNAMTTIEGNGFNTDYIAMHDRVLNDISTNKFILGRGNEGAKTEHLQSHSIKYGGIPTIVKDQAFKNTIATVGNQGAVYLAEGPTIVAAYDEDVVGYRGWLIKQWRFPYIVEPDAIIQVTGVSA